MMSHALIIGKFYPLHKGHQYLIKRAAEECNRVTVLIMWSIIESIPGYQRADWIREWLEDNDLDTFVSVQDIQDENPIDYSNEGWLPHMDVIGAAIWPQGITHVYSSEKYGEELARRLSGPREIRYPNGSIKYDNLEKVEHVLVDLDREVFPISATQFRADPISNWSIIDKPVQAGLTKRIVVCGAESSGTTTLARALAQKYRTVWVPEFGRLMSEGMESSDYFHWDKEDFHTVMKEQPSIEHKFARKAGPVMFCDTDLFATEMFYELYNTGEHDHVIEKRAFEELNKHSLYLITDHTNIEFEDDGFRRFEDERSWQTEWFINKFNNNNIPYVLISGTQEERIRQASKHIDKLMMKWKLDDPIEYRDQKYKLANSTTN